MESKDVIEQENEFTKQVFGILQKIPEPYETVNKIQKHRDAIIEAVSRIGKLFRDTRVEPTGQELVRIDELKELLENSEFFKAFVPTVSINDGEESYQYWAETINELLESVMAKFGQPRQELSEQWLRERIQNYFPAFEGELGRINKECLLKDIMNKLNQPKTEGGER